MRAARKAKCRELGEMGEKLSGAGNDEISNVPSPDRACMRTPDGIGDLAHEEEAKAAGTSGPSRKGHSSGTPASQMGHEPTHAVQQMCATPAAPHHSITSSARVKFQLQRAGKHGADGGGHRGRDLAVPSL